MKSKVLLILANLIATSNLFAFDFAVECLSSSINIIQGFGGITSIHLSLIEGPPQTVKMAAANLPAGTSVLFSPSDIPFDRENGPYPYTSTATVKVITSSSSPTGTHTIALTGTGGGLSRTISIKLNLTPLWAKGKIHYVSTSGNDSSAGTSAQPFRTIQHASDVSAPGDVIVVKAGEYKERIKVKNSGLKGSPITFLGEPGAMINAAQKVTGWQAAPEIASGVYKKAYSAMPIYPGIGAIAYKGKFCIWLGATHPVGEDMGPSMDLLKMPKDGFNTNGYTVPNPWDIVGALGYCDYENNVQMAYVRLASGQNPDNDDVEFAPVVPTLSIDGRSYITVSGFTIKNGWMQVEIKNQATGNIIEHNAIWGSGGVSISRWSADNIIRNNEIFMNFYYDNLGHPINATPTDNFTYSLFRKYLSYIQYGIQVSSAQGLQIYENQIYRHFSGIKMDHNVAGSLRIFRNYIHHNNGYSLVQVSRDTLHVHDNLVYESTHDWRIDEIANTSVIYIYRNRFSMLTLKGTPGVYGSGDGVCCDDIIPDTDAKIFLYHNSYSGLPISMVHRNYWGDAATGGLPYLFAVNNVFSNSGWIFWGDWWSNRNYHIDYNWIGGGIETSALGLFSGGNHNQLFAGNYVWDAMNPSFVLPHTSSPGLTARSAGIDLSKPWTLDGTQNPALPGMIPGYFSGSAPDLGAWAENNIPQNPFPGIRAKENIDLNAGAFGLSFSVNLLRQNANFQYVLHESQNVHFAICNSSGQTVRILDSGEKQKGIYSIQWDKRNQNGEILSNGVYYCRLAADKQVLAKKMLIVK